jgi:glycosyltransferase involved in cell wall biosynthesis
MKIHVYAATYNEERFLPFFLRHYDFAERIVIYDNESTDRTVEIAKANRRCEVRMMATGGLYLDTALADMKNHAWKEARGQAEWVIVVDVDELLWHRDLGGFLDYAESQQATICQPRGYNMIAREFPARTDLPITEQCRLGVPSPNYSKPVLFRPAAIDEINFAVGAHRAYPTGDVNWLRAAGLILLHYKTLGWDYLWQRTLANTARITDEERAKAWHTHLTVTKEEALHNYRALLLDTKVDVLA